MKNRIEIIDCLRHIHPDYLQKYNTKLARYVGGMVDDGSLNYEYCLFEASILELEDAYNHFFKKGN